ncbi:Kinesin heavy chain [Paragonimus heterotremus]|uniref:Kinesin-like protein n=1 Tax=Paragonimus heterotremus TaxID=100268 RepID=A0A8J4WTN2_9TREM|nr:Kinesin heavy chain [Paragonimus heterotremus]
MTAPVTRMTVKKEAITVVCRIRPLNQLERMKSSAICVSFPTPNSVAIGGKTYTFDVVLTPSTTQTEVYEKSASSIVLSVLNGYNGTIFAYGQTASGKTYTMEGRIKDAEHKGIIPRIIEDIFLHIEKMDENLEFLIKVSYFELYMEKIKDLLDISKTNLPIHETKDRVAYVKGVTERFVSCAEDVLDALDEGKMNRHVSVTNMNEHSSRSHSIFRICIQQNNRETGKQLIGSLYLVDLAGSEKVSRSGAEGCTLDEAKNINKSLSTLGNVINSLVEGNTHVPYRDSKLTRILQQSLGGNSKTTIIIAASPAASNEVETKSTLVFGVRAKTIKNQVVPNAQLTAEEWRRLYERELDRCKQLYSAMTNLDTEIRRWRNGEVVAKEHWFTEDCYGTVFNEIKTEMSEPRAPLSGKDLIMSSLPIYLPETVASTSASEGPFTDAAKVKMRRPQNLELAEDAKVAELFRMLDEKDDEINKQCQLVAKLENQLAQTREDYTRVNRESDKLQTLLEKAQRDADVRRSEVKDVLQALEELAVTYDEKNTECKKVAKDLEEMTTEMGKLKEQLELHETGEEELKANTSTLREKLRDLIYGLNLELAEVGARLSKVFSHTSPDNSGSVEEQAAVLKLYVLQIKTELQSLLKFSRPNTSEGPLTQVSFTAGTSTPISLSPVSDDFGEIRDFERKTKELQTLLAEAEKTIKRKQDNNAQLEADLRMLNKELLQQRTNTQLLSELKQINGMSEQLFARVHSTVERSATHIQEQLNRAKGDMEAAVNVADKLREENIVLKLQLERFVNEVDILRKRLDGSEPERNGSTSAAREQATNELKSMEDAVLHELGVLNSLRRVFISDLKNRIKKNAAKETPILEDEPIESQSVGTALQRERIAFLRSSLDNLTKVHKRLVRDNTDLRCDIPKLEKRVKASMERIKDLEVGLRESKEQMTRDKRRYHQELERIKEVNWTRGNARLRTNIVKPIRAGQPKNIN